MEFQLVVAASPDSHRFAIVVEPEARQYDFPDRGRVVLTFRGPDAMLAELSHYYDAVVIWRPADTEVWATTSDGLCELIAGASDNPAPGLDTAGRPLDLRARQALDVSVYNHGGPAEPSSGLDRSHDGTERSPLRSRD